MNPRESIPDQLRLSLRGDQAIRQAVDAARAFGSAQRLTKDELARLCIVVEELVANLYDHGGVRQEDEVQLAIADIPKGIRVSIVDPGIPFNPWSIMTAAAIGKGGGAGVNLIRAWTELISYRSSGGNNHIELLLPLDRVG